LACTSATRSASLLLLALGACLRGLPDAGPRPEAVEPAFGDVTGPTPVRIRGQFPLKASQSLAGAGGDAVDASYQAWVGGVALGSVQWLDERTLSAVVPAGLPGGPQALLIEDPRGRRGGLDGAFFAGVPTVVLRQEVALSRATFTEGQAGTLTVTVHGDGNALARGVLPALSLGGAGTIALNAAPPAADVPAGDSRSFTFGFTAVASGTVTLDVASSAPAPAGGSSSAPGWSGALEVQTAPSLTAELAIPPAFAPGDFNVTLTVVNAGQATAAGVQPGALGLVAGSTAPAAEATPFGAALDVPGGEARSFTAVWTASGPGSLRLAADAAGRDANTDAPAAVPLATSNQAMVGTPAAVELLAVDPLGDGSPFAFVNGWQGELLVGPNRTGRFAVQVGTASSAVSFELPKDTSIPGTTSRNSWAGAPPFPSLGAGGCPFAGLDACGPDAEDARGVFSVERVGGQAWVVAGQGRRLGDVRYAYLAPESGSPLSFRYADLSRVLPSAAVGVTAVGTLQDVVYLGLSGTAPHLVALRQLPLAPGMDVNPGSSGDDLGLDGMPGLGGSGTPANGTFLKLVDAIGGFGGLLYVANNGGLMRSTVAQPRSYGSHPEDWAPCTPSHAAHAARTSITSLAGANLEPRQRAVPTLAAWRGRLFAIRNADGPQLWMCEPAASGDPAACDPDDWTLAAPNASGDAGLTQLGDTGSTRATLLVATGGWLYLGLEGSPSGVRLFRTSAAVPAAEGDFLGQGGCAAGSAGCQGLGGDGLGDPARNTRFLDARALAPAGGPGLYLTSGNGTDPVRVHRLLD